MVDLVTLAEAKLWLRVMHDHENEAIAMLVSAASESVQDVADAWDGVGEVPARLKLAVLARVATAYDNRTNVSAGTGELPMLTPLRTLEV